MSLEDLDKKLWKRLKKEAGIKSSKWFKKADASVGKHIEAVNKQREKFRSTELVSDLLKYQSALDDLNKAFDKFVDTKQLDEISEDDMKAGEKDALKKEIDDWKDQVAEAKRDLDKQIVKIGKAAGGDMKKIEQAEAAKRKAIWDQTGISDTFNI